MQTKYALVLFGSILAVTAVAQHQGHDMKVGSSNPYLPAEMAMHNKMTAARGADAGEP